MEDSTPIKSGSTRSRMRCKECQSQKQGCHPRDRNWQEQKEKCIRCERLGLPCGPNLTAKEHKPNRNVKGHSQQLTQNLKRNLDITNKNERCPSVYPSYQAAFGTSSNPSSCATLHDDQNLMRDLIDSSPPSNFRRGSTQYHGSVSEECSRMGFDPSVSTRSQTKESELFDMLRTLDLKLEVWLYCKRILQKLHDENQIPWLAPSKMEQGCMYREIKLIVEKIEAFGDTADRNGWLCQAQIAYTRLIEKLRQMEDHDGVNSLLLKLAKFYSRNQDDVQAKETLGMLSNPGQLAPADQEEWKRMLLESYTKSSQSLSDLYRGSEQFWNINQGDSDRNIETPCPAFHRAVQDKAPAEVLSKLLPIHGLNDHLDIYRRSSIHIAVEADRVDLVNKLVQDNPTSVNERDSFGRTPLQLAVQHPCEHSTNLPYAPTPMCSRASVCKTLVVAGADRNVRDAAGCTTLMAAARAGCLMVVKELLVGRYGNEAADIKALSLSKQSTALQAAAENGHHDVVGILLVHGAKASYIRPDGKTADDLARARGHLDLADRLEQTAEDERARDLNMAMYPGMVG